LAVRSKGIVLACALTLAVTVGRADAQEPAAPTSDSQLKTGPATVAPHWSKYDYPKEIPEGAAYHIVDRGDTLWDLASRYLGNPYLWPQIWDQNRYVSDAHWIYPGDPLLMPQVALVSEQAGEAGALGPEGEEGAGEGGLPGEAEEAAGARLFPVTEEVTIQCAQTILPSREDESFRIIGSEQGATKVALADRDIVYLSKGSNTGIRPGDVFTIHHAAYNVLHPATGKKVGTKIETLGWLRVILSLEDTSTAVIEQACNDIHAGDYLKLREKINIPLILSNPPADRLTAPTGKASGYVVDIAEDSMIAGAGQLVSVDLGSEDGLAPGNILVAYRVMYPSVPTSRNVLGEMAILTVQPKTATAKVMYSADAIMDGDQVEVR
jgi:LysM domain